VVTTEDSGGGGGTTTAKTEKKIKIAMVTDIGGLNDRGSTRWPTRACSRRRPTSAPTSAC
jgi:hypothetical protein